MTRRTPGAGITNVFDAIVDPTVNDDESEALDIGSWWFNVTAGRVWGCLSNTVGAALWKDVSTPGAGSHPITVSAVDPTITDDGPSGFAVGDHWINTASLPRRAWQLTDASVGAATWVRVTNIKDNISSDEPLATNDSTEDYEAGSQWFDTAFQELYVCTDASVGAAIWLPAGQVGSRVLPGAVLVGGILNYPNSGSGAANEIQYVAVRLFSGRVYDRIVVFIDSGGTAARFLQGGVYDVTDPAVFSDPLNRVAQTDVVATNVTQPGYSEIPLTDGGGTPETYSPPVTGVYWLALIQSSNGIKMATTVQFRSNFLARRIESVGSTLLPATPGTLTNPLGALILVALLEQGVVLP